MVCPIVTKFSERPILDWSTCNSLKVEKEQKRSSLWITFDGDKSELNQDNDNIKNEELPEVSNTKRKTENILEIEGLEKSLPTCHTQRISMVSFEGKKVKSEETSDKTVKSFNDDSEMIVLNDTLNVLDLEDLQKLEGLDNQTSVSFSNFHLITLYLK